MKRALMQWVAGGLMALCPVEPRPAVAAEDDRQSGCPAFQARCTSGGDCAAECSCDKEENARRVEPLRGLTFRQ